MFKQKTWERKASEVAKLSDWIHNCNMTSVFHQLTLDAALWHNWFCLWVCVISHFLQAIQTVQLLYTFPSHLCTFCLMSPTFKTWASSSLFPPPFYKIAVKCCEPMRYSVCVLFAHKKHLNRTVALAGLLPCLFSVLCKVSSHTQRGWGRDQIHKGFLGKVSVCAKAKGGGLFFPLQTSCYIYSKDSAASNSH